MERSSLRNLRGSKLGWFVAEIGEGVCKNSVLQLNSFSVLLPTRVPVAFNHQPIASVIYESTGFGSCRMSFR